VELFDLFAMTMEISHINLVHPKRILKSMSFHIFNESQSKTYENFQLVYQDWLKYSDALTHLFLAYMRERSYSTNLPDRLNLLLKDYVECREECLRNCDTNEIIFKEHILPDITMENLDDAIKSMEQININPISRSNIIKRNAKKILKKNKMIKRRIRNSFYEIFPVLKLKENIKPFPNITKVNDPETVEIKWDELQSSGLYILSEEALKLLFIYDNFRFINLEKIKKKKQIYNNYERYIISSPLEFIDDPINNNYDDYSENIKWDEEFHESITNNSNIFSPTSTFSPGIVNSNEIIKDRSHYRLSCFKCHSSWSDWDWEDDWQNIEKTSYLTPSNSHDDLQHHYLERPSYTSIDKYFYDQQQYQYRDDDDDEKASQSWKSDQSVFERYTVKRGKELPYPLTPARSGRQSPIPGSRSSLFNRQIRVASQIPNSINTDTIEEIMEIIIKYNFINNESDSHSSQQLQQQYYNQDDDANDVHFQHAQEQRVQQEQQN
jgi:hypothetical protein